MLDSRCAPTYRVKSCRLDTCRNFNAPHAVRAMKKLVVYLLVMILGHVPVPWAHSHEGLDPDQLQRHLSVYPQTGDGNLQFCGGWHFHCFCLGCSCHVPGDGLNSSSDTDQAKYAENSRFTIELETNSTFFKLAELRHQSQALLIPAPSESGGQSRLYHSGNAGVFSMADSSLFQQHCALLI